MLQGASVDLTFLYKPCIKCPVSIPSCIPNLLITPKMSDCECLHYFISRIQNILSGHHGHRQFWPTQELDPDSLDELLLLSLLLLLLKEDSSEPAGAAGASVTTGGGGGGVGD